MKYVIHTIVIAIFPSILYACEKPLWEEDRHFLQYRALCLEGSVSMISELVEHAKDDHDSIDEMLYRIEIEIDNCKKSLGYTHE